MTKKNKIYIAIISFCILGTAGIMIFSSSSGTPDAESAVPVITQSTTPTTSRGSGPSSSNASAIGNPNFPAPSVFPADTKFDTSVLDSGVFKNLTDYVPVTVSPDELGVESLF